MKLKHLIAFVIALFIGSVIITFTVTVFGCLVLAQVATLSGDGLDKGLLLLEYMKAPTFLFTLVLMSLFTFSVLLHMSFKKEEGMNIGNTKKLR